jgi:transposase
MLSMLLCKIETAERDMGAITSLMLNMIEPNRKALDIVDSVPGFDQLAALLLLAEISAAPHLSFESANKLCSWAGLSPRNDESAGKTKSRKILPGSPYVKSILCQAAWAAVKSRDNPFRDWFWSHRWKLGEKKAIVAVSRQLLTTVYALLKNDVFYDPGIAAANRK